MPAPKPAKPPDMGELYDNLAAARTRVWKCWPYLSHVVNRMVVRWTDRVPAMAVDARWILYLNPHYVATLDVSTLALLIAGHEGMHALQGHADRLTKYRDHYLVINGVRHSLANVAHDLAINSSLQAFVDSMKAYRQSCNSPPIPMEVPADALYPKMFKDKAGKPFPEGLISEEYAELLMQYPEGKDKGGGCKGASGKGLSGSTAGGCGRCGSAAGDRTADWEEPGEADPKDPDSGLTEAAQETARQQVARAVEEHEANAAGRGNAPAGLVRWVKARLSAPKVDWRTELRRALREGVNWVKGRVDYTYNRPNRRQEAGGVILPGMHSPEPNVCLIVDTSGSMGQSDFDRVFTEVRGILAACDCKRVPVIACDATASEPQYINKIEQIKLVGGGGTDMGAGIERAVTKPLSAKFVVVLTDGDTGYGEQIPGVRVLACLTRKNAHKPPPWMDVVYCHG